MNAGYTGVEKPVGWIDTDVVARARNVRIDHAGENREKFLQRHGIVGRSEILPDGFEKPERGVNGVVFRLAASVWEIVRQHSPVHVPRKGKKDLPGNARAAGRER